ncbi:MarR family winged helix-turn-helix transcriptional regulator [Mycobacterium sp. THU-M104]|uniref:MarR family winged helix-turn-helix transcriptional regulator n=1 Tax=Mycobacterium sp. THU-M104 TaxID=3410515 RepID=UPI003B9A141D
MAESESTAAEVTELAEGLHRALSKLFSILRRGDPNTDTTGDLTLAQLSILVTLLDRGPIRMTDLATHERVRTPTTTVAIRRLEKIGLVERSRDPSDLRAVLVDITQRGRTVLSESLANRRAALAAMLTQLPGSDLNTLMRALAPLERLASGEPAASAAGESPARTHA